MNKKLLSFFLLLSIFLNESFAQADSYTGTWQLNYNDNSKMPVTAQLCIAAPEKNILYPASLQIQCGSFQGVYQLLLVRKSTRELAISRNKHATYEQPFSLKAPLFYLNGVFDLSRDFKGNPLLRVMRIKENTKGKMNAISKDGADKLAEEKIISFLCNGNIEFKKVNGTPSTDVEVDKILSPSASPEYFGIVDTIYIPNRDGFIHFNGDRKSENDNVSLAVNGRMVFDQILIEKKAHDEEILLDTGMNIVILFANNFGGGTPNSGKLNMEFGKKKINLDFGSSADSGASFIVAKVLYEKDKTKENSFQEIYDTAFAKSLTTNQKLVGMLASESRQLTFAIWDDAAEDGDTISIQLNNVFIRQGFAVKKQPQFLNVTLKPGPNTITFIPDNLGSIPPNTSVLEIIDGKKRRSFYIESTLGESNLVRIVYDTRVMQE